MQVKILRECGYEEALLGLSLSFYDHKMPLFAPGSKTVDKARAEARAPSSLPTPFWTDERYAKAQKIALHLATKTPPEDYETRNNMAYISAEQKFLESIDLWIFIQASRDFWSEFDTYRVDTTKQSSSTMHTLHRRLVDFSDFEEGIHFNTAATLNSCLIEYKDPESSHYHNVSRLKKNLPEGWLQERVVKLSYKTLKNILDQRDGHRLTQWKYFYDEIISQVEHPEFLLPKEVKQEV